MPTTTGTGAESTTICVLDVLADKVKTGISQPRLRPTLAVVDPALTVTSRPGSPRPAAWTSSGKQQRLLDTAPRPVTEDDAAAILSRSLANW